MSVQEAIDGKFHMDTAYRKAYLAGGWTFEAKEEAVCGAGMQDDAETGCCDIIQAFLCHNGGDEHFQECFGMPWIQFIDEEFEKNFHKDYKGLNSPCPEVQDLHGH